MIVPKTIINDKTLESLINVKENTTRTTEASYNPQPCIQPPINEKFNDDSISKKINDYVVTDSSYSNYSSRGEDDIMDQTRESEKKTTTKYTR